MRQFYCWVFAALAIIAHSGCSTTQQQQSPFGAFSGRNAPAAATPAQLAGYHPEAVQPPQGGYQAQLASASRSGRSASRFWFPKCTTSA